MTSRTAIYDFLITYFANRFHDDPNSYTTSTNVKQRHNFPDSAWIELADQLNKQPWLVEHNVRLQRSEMAAAKTIGDLIREISEQMQREKEKKKKAKKAKRR